MADAAGGVDAFETVGVAGDEVGGGTVLCVVGVVVGGVDSVAVVVGGGVGLARGGGPPGPYWLCGGG